MSASRIAGDSKADQEPHGGGREDREWPPDRMVGRTCLLGCQPGQVVPCVSGTTESFPCDLSPGSSQAAPWEVGLPYTPWPPPLPPAQGDSFPVAPISGATSSLLALQLWSLELLPDPGAASLYRPSPWHTHLHPDTTRERGTLANRDPIFCPTPPELELETNLHPAAETQGTQCLLQVPWSCLLA